MEHLREHVNFVRASIEFARKDQRAVPEEEIDQHIKICSSSFPDPLTDEEKQYIRFTVGNQFALDVSHKGTVIKGDVKRWLDATKTEIEWNYWDAYKKFLKNDEGRAIKIIEENENIIDEILDLSGNPKIDGSWARKGLVMGNVQSGKTQNYLGLINKAMDAGYKVVILLGGHMNNLRKQTQMRVDEGVIGRESKHIVAPHLGVPKKTGVGKYRHGHNVATVTSSDEFGDFQKRIANTLGITFDNLADPIIFTVKKNHSILKNLYEWIKTNHMLNPEDGKKLDLPLLFIDDEADYASINTKFNRDDITATNKYIREILGLFNRSTYVAYTATPFANIFIDPNSTDEMYGDDLFPKDFMIRVPVPDNYLGQDYYFPIERDNSKAIHPVVTIDDNETYMLDLSHKSDSQIKKGLAPSLKEAIRAFIISNSLRDFRGDKGEHKTMMINISHFALTQNSLSILVDDYLKEIKNSIENIIGDKKNRLNNSSIQKLEKTFKANFDVKENFEDVLDNIWASATKIKVLAVNTKSKQVLDYDMYPDGLSAIVIGGLKLSRGLTLSGLSVSYFARSSKAYDVLMQMCRWFGYRENYDDLCKVFMPSQSLEWYTHIAEAISDLYADLDTMSQQQKTPMEFGLKVRSHPLNLIVTAVVKAGNVENSVVQIDMWGTRERRFTFFENNEVNNKNLYAVEEFYKRLSKTKKAEKIAPHNSLLIEDVSHQEIIDFIESMNLVESDLGDRALYEQIRSMKANDLPNFKVLIKSIHGQATKRKLFWQEKFPDINMLESFNFCNEEINLQKRSFKSNKKVIKFPSAEAGSASDEKIFLSDQAIEEIISKKPNATNTDFIKSVERDFPAIIIYMFSISVVDPYNTNQEKIDEVYVPFDNPTVGLSISFPALDNQKGLSATQIKKLNRDSKVSYDTNAIHQLLQQEILPFTVEEEFLED